ncbi:zinc finger and SCAN domain-containing 9 [Labeo rohita]|uniref:Zinc finger and SCAN domain-containing 9 n=1 Tax=Labeo rohita TaxID=84645 RepID=A0A498M742_LABRO|nr:zinc finger and SCAN domain-containing 9 [Labeo rohita]
MQSIRPAETSLDAESIRLELPTPAPKVSTRQRPAYIQDSPNVTATREPTHWADPKMPSFQQGEDIENYLRQFKRLARTWRWPEEEWSYRLVPLLTRQALEAYLAMDEERSEVYTDLKEALLEKFNISPETYRQRFRSTTVPAGESPTETYKRLKNLYKRWVRPEEHSKEEIGEAIILEQLLWVLPYDAHTWEPETSLLVRKVEVEEESENAKRQSSVVSLTHLEDSKREELQHLLNEFPALFCQRPGRTELAQHTIHLSDPSRQHPYRVPERLVEPLKEKIKMMKDLGVIEPSTSEWSSPILCDEVDRMHSSAVSLSQRFKEGFTSIVPKVLELQRNAPLAKIYKEAREEMLAEDLPDSDFHAALILLPHIFKEKAESLITLGECDADNPYPTIQLVETDWKMAFSKRVQVLVKADGVEVCRGIGVEEGMLAAFSAYYVFTLAYPPYMKNTLTFLQHAIAKITEVFAEFTRIACKNLQNEFFGELDKHTPCLMKIFKSKTGTLSQTLAELLEQVEARRNTNQASCQENEVTLLRGIPVLLGDGPSQFFEVCFV